MANTKMINIQEENINSEEENGEDIALENETTEMQNAERAENITKGKEAVEREIKRIGMSHADLFKPQYVQAALDRYKYTNSKTF